MKEFGHSMIYAIICSFMFIVKYFIEIQQLVEEYKDYSESKKS